MYQKWVKAHFCYLLLHTPEVHKEDVCYVVGEKSEVCQNIFMTYLCRHQQWFKTPLQLISQGTGSGSKPTHTWHTLHTLHTLHTQAPEALYVAEDVPVPIPPVSQLHYHPQISTDQSTKERSKLVCPWRRMSNLWWSVVLNNKLHAWMWQSSWGAVHFHWSLSPG